MFSLSSPSFVCVSIPNLPLTRAHFTLDQGPLVVGGGAWRLSVALAILKLEICLPLLTGYWDYRPCAVIPGNIILNIL